jgi:exopolysaccharide biosynthesis polyprenyl glycosylphosphotransferase
MILWGRKALNEKEYGAFQLSVMIIIDAILINLGYFLAFKLKFVDIPITNYQDYVRLIPWIAVLTVIFFQIYGLYDLKRKNFTDIFFSTVLSVIMIMVFTMALTFLFRGFAFPRSVFAIGAIIHVGLVSFWKYLTLLFFKRLYGVQKVIMIGSKDEAFDVAQKFIGSSSDWFETKYIMESNEIDTIRDAISMVDIVCLCPGLSQELKRKVSVMALEQKKKIFLIPDLYEIFLAKSINTHIDDKPVFELIDLTLTREQMIIKRFFDILVSAIGIIITSPLMPIIALLIKATSPGPVLYTQERVGLYGKTFKLYKFRTMIDGAEKHTGPVLATENDTRIIPVGRFLRSTRLDELPQLFNVLKGEMSLVGPRPERPFFVKQFNNENPHYKYRHIVKPGITGLAQVMGKYRTSCDDKLRYDLIYIRNYSFLQDLSILFLTIKVVFMSDSSRGRDACENCDKTLLKKVQVLTSDSIAAAKD